jgi:hypothetical protein
MRNKDRKDGKYFFEPELRNKPKIPLLKADLDSSVIRKRKEER